MPVPVGKQHTGEPQQIAGCGNEAYPPIGKPQRPKPAGIDTPS